MDDYMTTDLYGTLNTANLFATLDTVETEGWDGPAATQLLRQVRKQIARPLAVTAGLRGLGASQGEASGWQAAWEVLAHRDLRSLDHPWGAVVRAVQHAVAGEALAARYGTNVRAAWRLHRAGVPPLASLAPVLEGNDGAPDRERPQTVITLSAACDLAVAALRDAGWPRAIAVQVVAKAADLPDPAEDPRSTVMGWRTMAAELGMPPWQARRLCLALLGTDMGLLGRLLLHGEVASKTPPMRAAMASTRLRRLPSPVLAASRAGDEMTSSRPQQIAS